LGALGNQAVELLAQTSTIQESPTKISFSSSDPTSRASISSASTVPISQIQNYDVQSNTAIDFLIDRIRQCCDANLVAKIGKFYRIQCELDGRIYNIDLNLQHGNGYCALTPPNSTFQSPCDVTFSLTYTTLISLIQGEISPVSAFLNGNVRVSGNIEDAIGLKHLAARAKELNLRLT
jgi:hypothetical protein